MFLRKRGMGKATGQSEVPDAVWDRDQLKHRRNPQPEKRGGKSTLYLCAQAMCAIGAGLSL